MNHLVKMFVPTVRVRTDSGNPWFTKTLLSLRNKKKRLFAKAKRLNTSQSWEVYSSALKNYTRNIKQAKNKFFFNDLPSILSSNPRKFWNLVSPKDNNSAIQLRTDNGDPIPERDIPTVFNEYFSSIFTNECLKTVPTLPEQLYETMPPISVCSTGIQSLIAKLKLSSSAGSDNINSKILKNTASISSEFLKLIFDQSLSESSLPSDWKVGRIVPVFKLGSRCLVSNYRPISLTSIASKLLEHILYSQIMSHLTTNRFFFKRQHGFRKGLSCETQLCDFIHDLHTNLECRAQTDAIFLDFSKAFDRVPHQRLLSKLASLRLDPLIFSWIRDFLSSRVQYTVANDHESALTNVSSGVPQGSVLGPLLFLIFINDLPATISSNIRLFADDCVLYNKVTNVHDSIQLQDDLVKINKWCEQWLMPLNKSKCKLICFTRKKNRFVLPILLRLRFH